MSSLLILLDIYVCFISVLIYFFAEEMEHDHGEQTHLVEVQIQAEVHVPPEDDDEDIIPPSHSASSAAGDEIGSMTMSEQSDTTSRGRQRKSRASQFRLSGEGEESKVLEWVEENRCLWDSKNKDYKNRLRKDRLWQEKAEELGYSGK